MSSKYKVTVWKTETFRSEIEIIAVNRQVAQEIALRVAVEGDEPVHWEFIDSDVEADTPLYGVSDD